MTLQIFDTLTRKKRSFKPLTAGKVGIYVCGMTVYDHCHLGHGRVMVAFDTIVRYLRFRQLDVMYVRNITDVDDKIFARAQERKIPFQSLTIEMIDEMHADEKKLGCQKPDLEPKATENVDSMLALIQDLMDKKVAYQGPSGDVYFRVSAFPEYGRLNNRKVDDMEAGARVAVAEDKQHPADFVLWKVAKEGEAAWDSDYGIGRPGWHIECSAMSMDALGTSFDIHGGGPDLKFPHHENEIAQSEAATGCKFARYWMHAGPVRVNREKMSKSLGNFVTLKELFQNYHPEVIRFFLLQSHYRSAILYSENSLINAETSYIRLIHALPDHAATQAPDAIVQFQQFMDDDFNTPRAIAMLFELASKACPESASSLLEIGKILGLFGLGKVEFLAEHQAIKASKSELNDLTIDELIAARESARKDRNFHIADQIRENLVSHGIVLEDGPNGTSWYRK